jgi:RNA polymerase sigma-70 factor (ECF subfamily)
MARYADGDVEGFDELFRRYEARIHGFFLRRTGSAERARDLYQELFLRIHRARDRYDPARPFAPWLFQIAHRLLVDDRRRAYRAHEVPLREHEARAEQPGDDDRMADREQIDQVLVGLSAVERYVLVSSRVDGVGYSELAARLGKSVDAVKKLASRATQRLRATTDHVAAIGLQTR